MARHAFGRCTRIANISGKKTAYLLRCHFILKRIIVPRQARDKHRESTQTRDAFSYSHWAKKVKLINGLVEELAAATQATSQEGAEQVRKRHFLGPLFILNMIILPRQARDKRRESTQKEPFSFLAGG